MNIRTLFLLLVMASSVSTAAAQDNFAELPARLKTKMAVAEEAEAAQDEDFQTLMTEGIELFEARNYTGAIEQFEAAQSRRPVNVYPPVLIADAELAMEMIAEEVTPVEEPAPAPEVPAAAEEDALTAEERVELMYQQELAKVYSDMPPAPKALKEEPKETAPLALDQGLAIADPVIEEAQEAEVDKAVQTMVTETNTKPVERVVNKTPVKTEMKPAEKQEVLANEFPDGVTEERFKEGNRDVVRRIVVKNGLGDEYRKVTHAWGGKYYFKNGISITERVWLRETTLD